MKIMTILGTRPEIIRLSRIIPLLDQYADHILVHTGQNYDPTLNKIFFTDLMLRQPDYCFDCKADTPLGEIGRILTDCEQVILDEKPDRVLILGDTNSALTALVAKRHGIPVFHMEAGNRCYDDRVPEEVNRRIIDHCSDILMPYTERSRFNLLREGIAGEKIYVTGNPIGEVLKFYQPQIAASQGLQTYSLQADRYFLVTLHRAENVDDKQRLNRFIETFHRIYDHYQWPVLCSLHPRTRSRLAQQDQEIDYRGVKTVNPLGLFDFVHLEKNAACVLTDSGTVQEECCIFNIPNVTLRDVTERPETIEAGSNLIAGSQPEDILKAVDIALHDDANWTAPPEYAFKQVSRTVLKILLGAH